MKIQLTLISFLLTASLFAQKYITKEGQTHFKASVEAFEPVEAENNSTTVVLNTENGQMAALIFVKAFRFDIALMEEHFNENYMDSDEHPKATFKGQIKDFDIKQLSSEAKTFDLTGILTVRGKEKEINTKVTLTKEGDVISVTSHFQVTPQEFGIEIPSLVREKIAENILIDCNYELKQKR